ncbi:1,4-dihydroxy-2-naphthoate polyprenyltransferase [Pseudochryseolinea flava]|uniref:1,4-dihydroxy-2-naphthoate octaprenyltransferase n=1 Tax=Pseudochryseolinea flava TaxID=2059302 RepID=A0A364Y241_9BACT|nr:1,4-dihydroxy-2-naphthoate polyprenyltransferase [Pseudochryseolinea flava]RAW00727.1 1,4-dihydroxy-2-naphthoate octaprenyltransferase [Pseudochryseolinea flava]
MTNSKVWLQAFRLRTLPLALSCIAMGGFLAASNGAFRWDIFLLCVTTTIFLQILSNLANDYGDSIHGADSDSRKGPSRAVQSGAISAQQMKAAVFLFVVLCLASGIALLLVSFGLNWNSILFFLALGLVSIGAAVAYTVGKRPYGYIGLGDLSVLIFFGLVGVLGSYYLFAKQLSWTHVLPALSCGFFSMGVLNINNIRDIASDRQAGKYSIPVRIGRDAAVRYHWFLLIAGQLAALSFSILEYTSPWQFLFLLSAPLFIKNGRAVASRPSEELDPYLKQMAISTLMFVVLFGVGLILARTF